METYEQDSEERSTEENVKEETPGRLKVYDSWFDLPIDKWGSCSDLDGVLIYHTGERNKVANVLLDRYYFDEEAQALTPQECKTVRVLYPASIIGLHH